MPYIKKEQRELIDGPGGTDQYPSEYTTRYGLDSFIWKMGRFLREDYCEEKEDWPNSTGTLNYIITKLVHWYLGDNPNYERYNAAIGVLECAKLELYRRKVAPYENVKCAENGDV